MSVNLTKERLDEISKELRLDRCDWCGWPLVDERRQGCVLGDCSMRPRPPLSASAQSNNDLRTLVRMARRALEKDAALDAARKALALFNGACLMARTRLVELRPGELCPCRNCQARATLALLNQGEGR